jgi:cation transport protein ChaC
MPYDRENIRGGFFQAMLRRSPLPLKILSDEELRQSLAQTLRRRPSPGGDVWVFGYGSLIWKPGFPHDGTHPALLRGFHRRFCLWSRFYRGTPEAPGLVLGLDRGGACRGVAFRVPSAAAEDVLAYLDARENMGAETVYDRRMLPVRLLDAAPAGRRPRVVRAVAYVANRAHPSYCRPCPDTAAAAIARGVGQAGANRDYLLHTVAHLRAMGVRDAGLDRITRLPPPPLSPA